MTKYFLPKSVYACFTGDGTVFLDVKRDQYFGLALSEARMLKDILEHNDVDTNAEELARSLSEKGLLTMDAHAARGPQHCAIKVPAMSLLDERLQDAPRVSFRHMSAFLLSCATVWADLHLFSFANAIEASTRRKNRMKLRDGSFDQPLAEELLRVFIHIRPLIYVYQEKCLFDSLVMVDFFRRFGVASTCVFGVKTLPFGAHCWVQVDDYLAMDGSPEYITGFTPILSI